MLVWPRKTPDEFLDYTCDWTGDLSEGETIETSTWTALDSTGVAPDVTMSNESFIPEASATVWLDGGVPGRKYYFLNKVVTNAGRKIEQILWLRITEKD
jgi:hypothetical protein